MLSNSPKAYNWEIFPKTAKYNFVGGTNASSASPKIIFQEAGIYDVKLSTQYSAGSDDTLKTAFINAVPTGLSDLIGIKNLQIFPNPSTGIVYVNGEFGKTTQVQILDIQGKMIEQVSFDTPENQFLIDFTHFQKGVYFIQIQSDDKINIEKIILN